MYDIRKKLKIQSSKLKILKKYGLKPKKYLLATVHRQENTDIRQNLENIITAFIKIQEPIVFPVHPRTMKFLKGYGLDKEIAKHPHIQLIEPIGFFEMIALETNAKVILTDSGGVQKEAYLDKVPCVTLRKETEWVETVASGWNRLADTNVAKIVQLAKKFPKPRTHPNFLGDGRAYLKIARIIKQYLRSKK